MVFGSTNEPFSVDLRFLLHAIAVSKSDIYMPELNCSGPCMSKHPYYNLYVAILPSILAVETFPLME